MAGKGPADLQVDRLLRVVAHPLAVRAYGRPSRPRELLTSICTPGWSTRRKMSAPWTCIQMSSRHARSLTSSKITSGSAPRFSSILSPMGTYLIGWADQEAQSVVAVLAEDADHAVGQRRRAELRVLVVGQQVHPHQLVAVFGRAVAVLDLERHGRALKTPHPLGPAVGDRLGAFDGVDEVFAQAFLDDFFGLPGLASAAQIRCVRPRRLIRPPCSPHLSWPCNCSSRRSSSS